MAISIDATNLTTISAAESTSGWTGPTLAQEDEIIKENTYSISSIVRNDNTSEYYGVTNQDYSNQHLRMWISTGVYGLMDTTGKTGLRFYVYDGSNTAYWNIADKSTYQGGWINIVVDTANPDTGSATMTSIDRLGVNFGLTGSAKRVINTYVDALRYGDGYSIYGSPATTGASFYDIAEADVGTTTKYGYGVVIKYQDVYFLSGALQIGRTSEATTFSEQGSTISFTDSPVSSTLYGITVVGHASSTFSFNGCVLTAAGTQNFYLDFDATSIVDFDFIGCTVQKASTIKFRASDTVATVTGCTFDTCAEIRPNGATFENNTITNTEAATSTGSVYIDAVATATAMKNITFSKYSNNSRYAIYVPAGITSFTMSNWQFDDPDNTTDYALYWAGTSGTLTISKTNGTNLVSAGCTAASGGTVVAQASVSIDVHVVDSSGTDVASAFVYVDENLGSAGNITNTTTDSNGDITQASYTGAATSATLRVRKYGYKAYITSVTLESNSATNVTLVTDPQQT